MALSLRAPAAALLASALLCPALAAAQDIGSDRIQYQPMVAPSASAHYEPPAAPDFPLHATVWVGPLPALGGLLTGVSTFSVGGEVLVHPQIALHLRGSYARGFTLPNDTFFPNVAEDSAYDVQLGADLYDRPGRMGLLYVGPRFAVRYESKRYKDGTAAQFVQLTPGLEVGLRWTLGHFFIGLAFGVGFGIVPAGLMTEPNHFVLDIDALRIGAAF